MDILIFNPPRFQNGAHHRFNNALLWLGSYLHQRGVGVRIVPLTGPDYAQTVADELATHKPRFAAISCKWWDTLYSSTMIASLIKELDPSVVTIAGGQTATFFAGAIVADTDIDVVICGDGEEPLYRLVTGREPINCVHNLQGDLQYAPHAYVQSEEDLDAVYLVEDLAEIVADPDVINGFVWTGKGCVESCVYCAANAWNNKRSFGRTGFVYRPTDRVIHDIQVLSKFRGGERIIFDFDYVRGPGQDDYYAGLFRSLAGLKLNTYFCSWAPPEPELIDQLAETFNFVELCIDVQAPSERLRRELGDRRIIKPYYPNERIYDILSYTQQFDHFMVDISTLMGLPFETEVDIAEIRTFTDRIYDSFSNVRYPYVSPMNVEPGSLLMRSPDRYGMTLFRETFDDFFTYTRHCFEHNVNYYQPETYEEGVLHPLGACPTSDLRRGDAFRVYEAWRDLQGYIDQRSRSKMFARAGKYVKYGITKTGVLGGLDHGGQERPDAE